MSKLDLERFKKVIAVEVAEDLELMGREIEKNPMLDKDAWIENIVRESERKAKLFKKYGIESDVLDKLEAIKRKADAGDFESSESLMLINYLGRQEKINIQELVSNLNEYISINRDMEQYTILDEFNNKYQCYWLYVGDDELLEDRERLQVDFNEILEDYYEKVSLNEEFLVELYGDRVDKIGVEYYYSEELDIYYRIGKYYYLVNNRFEEISQEEMREIWESYWDSNY